MKKIFLLCCILMSTILSAQDSIHVQTNYTNGLRNEDYFRNKEGNKHGLYLRYSRYGKIFIEGQYKNGVPVGIWKYYSSDTLGTIVQILDQEHHKEIFVDSLRVPYLICSPRFFGGSMNQQEYIQQRIKTDFTPAEREKLKGKSVLAVFEVDKKTLTTFGVSVDDPTITQDIRLKMIRIVNEMPAWLPPVCKGDNMVWRMSVAFVFE